MESARSAGMAGIAAAIALLIGWFGSMAFDPMWLFIIAAIALMIFWMAPAMHRMHAGADDPLGLWGLWILRIAGTAMVLFALTGVVWEFILDRKDDPAFVDVLFPVLGISLLIGFVLFGIGIIKAKMLPRLAALMLLAAWPVGLLIDAFSGQMNSDEETIGGHLAAVTMVISLFWLGWSALQHCRGPASMETTPTA